MSRRFAGRRLQGWTLTEMLVVMIVSGIVFVAVMEGLALAGRYAGRKTGQIVGNMELYDGYYLLRSLAAEADSVAGDYSGASAGGGFAFAGEGIRLFREGVQTAELALTDSLLIASRGPRIDTLLRGVAMMKLVGPRDPAGADSVRVMVRTPDNTLLPLTFAIASAASRTVLKTIEQREKEYEYDDM